MFDMVLIKVCFKKEAFLKKMSAAPFQSLRYFSIIKILEEHTYAKNIVDLKN